MLHSWFSRLAVFFPQNEPNVDEQLIKLKTGHASDAVRSFSDKQLSSMSDIISCKAAKNEKSKAADGVEINVASDTVINSRRSLSGILSECQFNGTVNINVNLQ